MHSQQHRTRCTKGRALPLPAQHSTDLHSFCRSGSPKPYTTPCYPRGRCSCYCYCDLMLIFFGPLYPTLFSQHSCNSAPICSKLVTPSPIHPWSREPPVSPALGLPWDRLLVTDSHNESIKPNKRPWRVVNIKFTLFFIQAAIYPSYTRGCKATPVILCLSHQSHP